MAELTFSTKASRAANGSAALAIPPYILLQVGKSEYRPMDERPNRSYLIFSHTLERWRNYFQMGDIYDIIVGSFVADVDQRY